MIQLLIDRIDLFHNPFIVEDDVIDTLPHQDLIKELDSVASKGGSYYPLERIVFHIRLHAWVVRI